MQYGVTLYLAIREPVIADTDIEAMMQGRSRERELVADHPDLAVVGRAVTPLPQVEHVLAWGEHVRLLDPPSEPQNSMSPTEGRRHDG